MSLSSTGHWTAPWDTRTAADGVHTLVVTATTSTGTTAQSSVSVTVDNDYLTLQVIDPTEGENVARTVLLQLSATSATGTVTSAAYTVAGATAPMAFNAASGNWEAQWDSTTVAPGPVAITFQATDSTGATAAATRNVQVIDTYGSGYGAPVIAGDLVYTGAYSGGLKVLRLDTGEVLTTLVPDMDVQQTVIPAGGFLFVPERQSGLRALKPL